jgi:hypothetical protein
MATPSKKRSPRSPNSGQFEAPTPANDVDIRSFAVNVVNSVERLKVPLLAMMGMCETVEEQNTAKAVLAYLLVMQGVHAQYLDPETPAGPLSMEKVTKLVERMQVNWKPVLLAGVKK